MQALLVNQFFHPDIAATAQIMSDLAFDMAAAGATVSVLTGQGAYVGGGRYPRHETVSGVEIHRVPVTSFGRSTHIGRMADYLSFGAGCGIGAALLPKADVVLTLSTPPLLSLLGSAHRRLFGSRFVYWVQDLYPDVAVSLGVLKAGSPATRALERASRASLDSADVIVAIGESMAARLAAKGVPESKLHVVHNWSEGGQLGRIDPAQNWFRGRHGLGDDAFVVLYSGNMGRAHDIATLLEAARQLEADPRIVFLFVGDGAKRGEVERAAARQRNVRLLPYQRREDLPFSIGAADLCAVTLLEGLEGLIVPSKLYGALAARKPVLWIGPGASEPAWIIEKERCGGSFRPGDAGPVADFVRRLADERDLGRQMGERARAAFDCKYDRLIATKKIIDLCDTLAEGRGDNAPSRQLA